MPSAQQVEVDEQEIRASNISYLNSVHGRGKVLFAEGDSARGIYILRAGRAAISISSSEGRVVILRMAQPGDVLGLNAVLRSSTYDTTVRTLEPCRTDFISRAELLKLMGTSPAGTQAILKMLSHELTELTERTKSVLLLQTATARLAKLLLEWSRKSPQIDRVFTHEEIAQMICSSRETVTRLLASLSRRNIIQITPDILLIRDRGTLEQMALG